MNNELSQNRKPASLKDMLTGDAMRAQFAAALPKHLTADRFVRVALTALTRTPKLADCTQASLFRCLLDLSALGIEPDGRRAHLIPFENRKKGTTECQLIIDYKGIAELVLRSGEISNMHADKVCENDEFAYNLGRIEHHRIDFRKPRGDAYAFYCIVKFRDGTEKHEVMSRDEVEGIRNRSQGYKTAMRFNSDSPWTTDFEEMAKKTVFRRASKWLPLSPEIRDALEKDEEPPAEQIRPANATVRTVPIDPFAAAPQPTPTALPQPAAEPTNDDTLPWIDQPESWGQPTAAAVAPTHELPL